MKLNHSLFQIIISSCLIVMLLIFSGCSSDKTKEKELVTKIINDSFGWALTKDRALFESIFAHDDEFFTYYLNSKDTVRGWEQLKKYLDVWSDPRNKALGFDIQDLRLNIARSGKVAWFSAVVNDEGEWDGKPWSSKDIRWTGVLEKREGKWVIVQQHMSQAVDVVLKRAKVFRFN